MRVMSKFELFLRRRFQFKEIGWTEIGEEFTRFSLWRTKWFNVYLHRLNAPAWHPECHDHPWGFIAILVKNGYLERVGKKDHHRRVGSILFRPAEFTHNVITPYGTSWSIILTTPKSRDWGFRPCERHEEVLPLSWDEYREIYSKENPKFYLEQGGME